MPDYFHVVRLQKAGRVKRSLIPFTAPDDVTAWGVRPPGEDPGVMQGGAWVRLPLQASAARGASLAEWDAPIRRDTMQPIEGA